MGKRGQALVEFVLILPVFVMFLLGIVDFGNVLYKKYHLENDLDYVVELYKQNKMSDINNYISQNKLDFDYEINGDMTTIKLSKKVDIVTPGANLIFDSPYTILVDRVIYNA
ncbi:MAG: TadE/TadG family type IV pilus assembly protein [Ignavibacteriales bacterium]